MYHDKCSIQISSLTDQTLHQHQVNSQTQTAPCMDPVSTECEVGAGDYIRKGHNASKDLVSVMASDYFNIKLDFTTSIVVYKLAIG